MELRSFNVERIYKECVICSIGEDLGVKKLRLQEYRKDIIDMLYQIQTDNCKTVFQLCNLRKDGETWTPYLQIVEMLLRLGRKIGAVEYEGKLTMDKVVIIKV